MTTAQARNQPGVTKAPPSGEVLRSNPELLFGSDLETSLARLMGGPAFERGEPQSRLLLKEPSLRVILVALRKGGEWREHDISGPCTLQCLSGRAKLVLHEGSSELTAGSLVAMGPGTQHRVEANEDTGLLVTIGETYYRVQ